MRRGLMHWDARELPLELFETRIVRLRKELALAGLNGLIIYTNNVRPSAVHYLTGFTPYWSEGLLLLPIRDRPVFATALSNRVADWIRSNDPVSEVISTPRPGTLLGERLAGDVSANQIGILEIDAMPCELFDDLSAAAPDILWVDASTQFATARSGIDTAEQRMLARADALAVAAFDQVDIEQSLDAGALAALIEKHVRLAGAEEIYLAVAPDLTADHRLNRVSKPAKLTERFCYARVDCLQRKLDPSDPYLRQRQFGCPRKCLVRGTGPGDKTEQAICGANCDSADDVARSADQQLGGRSLYRQLSALGRCFLERLTRV